MLPLYRIISIRSSMLKTKNQNLRKLSDKVDCFSDHTKSSEFLHEMGKSKAGVFQADLN